MKTGVIAKFKGKREVLFTWANDFEALKKKGKLAKRESNENRCNSKIQRETGSFIHLGERL